MELLQLYYFKTVAQIQHISRAAEYLHITQPSLSQSIRRLETEMDTSLFDRTGRGISLNEDGKIFLKYVNTIFDALDNAKTEIAEHCGQTQKILSLSVQSASLFLPALLKRFRQAHADTIFHISQNTKRQPSEKFDLIIHSSIHEPDDNHHLVLLKEKLVLVLPKEHPLATKPELYFSDVQDEPFIAMADTSNLNSITGYYYEKAGFSPSNCLYCDNPGTLRELLNLNFGVSFLPEISWGCRGNASLVTREPKDLPCSRYILLSWDPNSYLSELAREFRDMTVDFFQEMTEL